LVLRVFVVPTAFLVVGLLSGDVDRLLNFTVVEQQLGSSQSRGRDLLVLIKNIAVRFHHLGLDGKVGLSRDHRESGQRRCPLQVVTIVRLQFLRRLLLENALAFFDQILDRWQFKKLVFLLFFVRTRSA
jgi:hypothetical protein